ncbi:MAG: hypothetical protein Tp1123DCM257201_42 [Prokaryotic dsDNA virus sp.]|nr:MAG: hypothetical protein Tp1123DCM257201_42 [Prokaryotic dsDNA virus sp.]|tara:strand:+ start:5992 stop:6315 length:324 start_codon:yes stop_codon:yes gene_type:complete
MDTHHHLFKDGFYIITQTTLQGFPDQTLAPEDQLLDELVYAIFSGYNRGGKPGIKYWLATQPNVPLGGTVGIDFWNEHLNPEYTYPHDGLVLLSQAITHTIKLQEQT